MAWGASLHLWCSFMVLSFKLRKALYSQASGMAWGAEQSLLVADLPTSWPRTLLQVFPLFWLTHVQLASFSHSSMAWLPTTDCLFIQHLDLYASISIHIQFEAFQIGLVLCKQIYQFSVAFGLDHLPQKISFFGHGLLARLPLCYYSLPYLQKFGINTCTLQIMDLQKC
jgi:hypothetical protein